MKKDTIEKLSNEFNDEIIRNVYSYYIQNKANCKLYYDDAEKLGFDEIYNDIEVVEAESVYPKVAIIILTANKYERNVLHSIYYKENKNKIQRFDIKLFPEFTELGAYGYLFNWHEYVILNIHASAKGSYSNGGSADLVRYIGSKSNLLPMMVISCGICFGVDHKKQRIGDTYLSEKIYPYFIGSKISKEKFFASDDNVYKTNVHFIRLLNNSYFGVNKHKDILDSATLQFDFTTGNYITGEAVVSDKEFRDFFVGVTSQEIKAGEMEAYGMYKECGFLGIPCLTIKSICDWGTAKNDINETIYKELNGSAAQENELALVKDRIQAVSSANAVKALESLLRNKLFNQSLYNLIKKWLLDEYHDEGIFHETIIEQCKKILIQKEIRITNSDLLRFVCGLIDIFKKETILIVPDGLDDDNMWIINRVIK